MPSQFKMRIRENIVLFACCALGATSYTFLALKIYMAHRLSTNMDQASLMRAVRLEPQNAGYHDLLGRYLIFVVEDRFAAAAELKEAVALNPSNAFYWLDLAQADLSLGSKLEEQEAIKRALASDPTTPDVAWAAANLLLFQGDVEHALSLYAVVLNHSPKLVRPSLDQCWHMTHSAERILPLLPPEPDVYLQFLHLLIVENEPIAAAQVWQSLLHLNKVFDYHEGLFYVDSLLLSHEVAQAVDAWEQLARRSAELKEYRTAGNMVTNSDFSHDILNSGFDWHYAPSNGAALSLNRSDSYGTGSTQSVSIVYTGAGDDAGLRQVIAVKPDTLYRLSASVKSDDLQAAIGPTLDAMDTYNNKRYAATDETLGTTDWHEIAKTFRSGPATQLITISVLRNPASSQIRGTFWIDNVAMRSIQESQTAFK
jgi:tetratricopeptide (TPR) repeat protein